MDVITYKIIKLTMFVNVAPGLGMVMMVQIRLFVPQ